VTKVSIVTAVRNGADSIGTTLDSVNAQTFEDLEHVIVDGASTDSTLAVLRAHARRAGPLISERDKGVYDAFNKGLKLATGDWIGFLGAGDQFADTGVVARLVAAAGDAQADAVYGDLAIVDPANARITRRYRSRGFSAERIGSGYMPAHPTLLVRRSVYEKFGGFDTSYRIAGDFEFVARAFGAGRIRHTYLPEVLVLMQDGGLSNRGLRSKWTITREMRRACRENRVSSGWLRLLMRLPMKYLSESFKAQSRFHGS
jgi:glycosyltransferase involved in cell wall biosynthesis